MMGLDAGTQPMQTLDSGAGQAEVIAGDANPDSLLSMDDVQSIFRLVEDLQRLQILLAEVDSSTISTQQP